MRIDMRATKSDNKVVFPAPGSPEIILTEPTVIPPDNTRSSSPIPVADFSVSTEAISLIFLAPRCPMPAYPATLLLAREGALVAEILISCMVFHAPHLHCPCHRAAESPQSVHTNAVLSAFAIHSDLNLT